MGLLIVMEALLLGGAVLCAALAFLIWRRKTTPAGHHFCALLIVGAVYALSVVFELMSSTLEAKIFWSKIQYLPGVSLAPLWFLFAMVYGDHQSLLTRRRLFLIWLIPVVTLVGALTNEWHHWVWTKVWLVEGSPYGLAAYGHGPLVWILMWYSYGLEAVAALIMIRQTFRTASLHPSQTVALTAGALLPCAGNVISATGLGPWQGFEIAALAFVASGILMSWGVLRFHLFRMTSVAYDTILAGMDEAVIIINEDRRIVYLNAAAKQLLPVDTNCVDRPLANAGAVGARLAEIAHGTSVFCVTSPGEGQSEPKYLEVAGMPLKTSAGHAGSSLLMLMVRDITDRKKAEEKAIKGQEAIRQFNRSLTILNQISNGLAAIGDLDELCRQAVLLGHEQLGFDRLGIWFLEEGGRKARGSFGVDENGQLRDERLVVVDGWYGTDTEQLLNEEMPYDLDKDIDLIWTSGVVGRGDRVISPMWDGKHIIGLLCSDNLLSGKPFTNEQCQILALFANSLGHLCSVHRAQQEQRKIEVKLHQAQKMEAIGQLAGGVAHDFNNMLAVVLGYTEMAMKRLTDAEPVHAMLLQAQKTIQRSSNLTRQLLAFARRETVIPKVVDPNDIVGGTLKILKRLIGENIELIWKPAIGLWSVRIDPAQLDQILINLLVNARDAIENTGAITVETSNAVLPATADVDSPATPAEYVLLTISDSGVGMDKETCDRIFEPFFTTKEVGKGTGLGLSTVYGVVKQNNGYIDVQSAPGQGTVFRVYLPRVETIEPVPAEEPPVNVTIYGSETVLIVEDEPATLTMIQTLLEELGYTTLAADNPADALRMARDHASEIDLVITDVVMPGMNGRELVKELTASRPALKSLYVSGYTADVIAKRGVLDEGIDFLHKPFSLRALAEKVRMTLDWAPDPQGIPEAWK